jgi:uncharacterized UBP type Zn finger protein
LFSNYLLSRIEKKAEKFDALEVMTKLVNKILSNNGNFSPKELSSQLPKIGEFRLYRQEDSQEFLINLIEKMEKSIISKYEE